MVVVVLLEQRWVRGGMVGCCEKMEGVWVDLAVPLPERSSPGVPVLS